MKNAPHLSQYSNSTAFLASHSPKFLVEPTINNFDAFDTTLIVTFVFGYAMKQVYTYLDANGYLKKGRTDYGISEVQRLHGKCGV